LALKIELFLDRAAMAEHEQNKWEAKGSGFAFLPRPTF
jgi:hypothetical protein